MPYLEKSLQFQIVFIGMAYVETVNQFENIKFKQLLRLSQVCNTKNTKLVQRTQSDYYFLLVPLFNIYLFYE